MTKPSAWAAGLALALSFFCGATAAQDTYPSKPLRWIVGYAAGGGSDIVARLLAEQIGKQMGQTVVVINQPGAAGAIAATTAARAEPDGYTLFSADNGILVFNDTLYKKLTYDPMADFAPVGLTVKLPLVLAVGASSPHQKVEDLVSQARTANPPLAYAAGGVGNPHHLATELFRHDAGIQLLPVMYRGGGPALNAVLSGEVPMLVIDTASGLQMIRSGKVRALGVFNPTPLPWLPGVPSLVASGQVKLEASAWQGVVVPAATPRAVIDRLSRELRAALAAPAVRQRLDELALIGLSSTPEEMTALIEQDRKFWPDFISRNNLGQEK